MAPALQTSANSGIPAGLRKKAYDDVSGATGHAAAIMFVAPDGDVLLCRRSPAEKNYGGHWALPGGKAEPGETPETTAEREAREELGEAPKGARKLVDRRMTPTGMAFHTFAQPVDNKFSPRLNEEHVGYAWFPLDQLPNQLHPGVEATLKEKIGTAQDMSPEDWSGLRQGFLRWTLEEESEGEHAADIATDSALVLALDRESVRDFDQDGRLRIAMTNISKANVCPYRGEEIPGWKDLGLDKNKIYQLLRDPEELAKASASSNGVQLLRKHVPVNAEDHRPYDVVGATGTDATFEHPYLRNSLAVWSKEAIDEIESEAKRELSAGYHYRPDMTPGNFDGKDYDGVMRDIVFNHVALVETGRAGPDVVVADSMGNLTMSKPTRIAAIALGLTSRAVRPLLAMDKKIDLMPIFKDLTTKNFAAQKPKIIAGLKAELKGKTIAQDVDIEHVAKMLDHVEGAGKADMKSADESVSEPQHKAMEAAANGESNLGIPKAIGEEFAEADKGKTFDAEPIKAFLKEKGMTDDDIENVVGMLPKPATDEFPPKKDEDDEEAEDEDDEEAKKKADEEKAAKDAEMKNMVSKDELDKTLKAALEAQAKTVRATERDIRLALDEVRPYVGNLTLAFDSGEQVRRHALKTMNVDGADTIHASALSTIIAMQPKPGARPAGDGKGALALDAAAVKSFAERFPEAQRISQV